MSRNGKTVEVTGVDIPKDWIVERQGKKAVLYKGLLHIAHERGLLSIDTELIQAPTDANRMTAIVRAVVHMAETDSKPEGRFSGIGDADPTNVTKMLVPHTIRMAETRAKARALRDALDIDLVAAEELGDHDDDDDRDFNPPNNGRWTGHRESAPPPQRPAPPPERRPAENLSGPSVATPAQVKAIFVIARNERGWSESDTQAAVRGQYGCAVEALTKAQASELLDSLKAKAAPPPAETPLRDEPAGSPKDDDIDDSMVVPKGHSWWQTPKTGLLAQIDTAKALGVDLKAICAELGIPKIAAGGADGMTKREVLALSTRLASEIRQREPKAYRLASEIRQREPKA